MNVCLPCWSVRCRVQISHHSTKHRASNNYHSQTKLMTEVQEKLLQFREKKAELEEKAEKLLKAREEVLAEENNHDDGNQQAEEGEDAEDESELLHEMAEEDSHDDGDQQAEEGEDAEEDRNADGETEIKNAAKGGEKDTDTEVSCSYESTMPELADHV